MSLIYPKRQSIVTRMDDFAFSVMRTFPSCSHSVCTLTESLKTGFFQLDPVERALDIFSSLDVDNNGVVTEEEFVEGCLTDPNFLAVLQTFNCDFIWSTQKLTSGLPSCCTIEPVDWESSISVLRSQSDRCWSYYLKARSDGPNKMQRDREFYNSLRFSHA